MDEYLTANVGVEHDKIVYDAEQAVIEAAREVAKRLDSLEGCPVPYPLATKLIAQKKAVEALEREET